MKYEQKIVTKDGKEVYIRSGEAADGSAVLENFNQTHAESDYLLSYPDENTFDAEQESRFLARKAESPKEIELLALVDGRVVGTAGIDAVGTKCKVAHRAEFGVSVLKAYWGMGIGRALTQACIRCAREAGNEDDAYMSDPNHHHVFALNTVCGYDSDIIPYLRAKTGSAYRQNNRGTTAFSAK